MGDRRKAKSLKLKRILEIHGSHARGSAVLANAVADGYLYSKNKICRNVRDTFLGLGYTYGTRPPFLYAEFKVLGLPEILANKIVPYVDNVSWLKKLEDLRPGFFELDDFFGIGPDTNWHFHESAHCIADNILNGGRSGTSKLPRELGQVDILRVMLGESFATAFEFMAVASSGETAFAKWAVMMNFTAKKNYTKGLRDIMGTIGLSRAAQLCTLLALYSNFLYLRLNQKDRSKIFDFIGLELKLRRSKTFLEKYRYIEKAMLNLNIDFRVNFANLYFKRLGYSKDISKLVDFEPLDMINESPLLRKQLSDLGRVIDGTYFAEKKAGGTLLGAA